MFRLYKLILTGLTIFMIAALSACNMLGQETIEPTPAATTVDIGPIKTAAVETAQMQMTLNAPSITPTLTITLTLLPSETSAGILLEETPTATETLSLGAITLTPTETPFGATAIPSFTPISGGGSSGNPSGPVCKNAAFDGDITVPDGTVFEPWEKFTKVWSVRNTGTCKWDDGFYFAAVSGPPSMGAKQGPYKFRSAKDFIEPGEAVNIGIDMYAPGDPGEYVAHWHMYDDLGKPFGGDFTVVIKVVK